LSAHVDLVGSVFGARSLEQAGLVGGDHILKSLHVLSVVLGFGSLDFDLELGDFGLGLVRVGLVVALSATAAALAEDEHLKHAVDSCSAFGLFGSARLGHLGNFEGELVLAAQAAATSGGLKVGILASLSHQSLELGTFLNLALLELGELQGG